ncbi:MAG: thiol reductant ABC exporter subunit CydD [Solirubrobacteraceae bacterium]
MPHDPAFRPGRRGIVDPRLLQHARAARSFIGAAVAIGFLSGLLIIAQAWLLADVIAGAFAGKGLTSLRTPLTALLAVAFARATVAWGTEFVAGRSSALAKRQLREALLHHVVEVGAVTIGEERTGKIATLATRGLDALDAYFSLYLPQLVLAAIVPAAVVVAVAASDWISAGIIIVTLPLIPVFMALVGATTRERTQLQVRTLQRLAGHFFDAVSGLPTLKVFGAAKRQIRVIAEISDRHRVAMMATLRVTFLSSLVLELLATISVALVAVAVGLRLLYGDLDLRTALFVLVLAPEAYLPLRALGANYHASAEGMSAAEQAFEVLAIPVAKSGRCIEIPDVSITGLHVDQLRLEYPGRGGPALDEVSLHVEPGEILAVTGPSGSGKSSLLKAILGFIAPAAGSIWIGDAELSDLDPDAWRQRVCWLPQRPHLFNASIADNIWLARPDADGDQVWRAALAAGLGAVMAMRPQGIDTMLGEHGAGLSAGERQRVALARAFLRDAPLLLLDEPTANLDGETEAEVIGAIETLMRDRTAIVVAHRPALVAVADRVVDLDRVAVPA